MTDLIELLRSVFPNGCVEQEDREGQEPALRVSAPADAFDAFQAAMDDLVSQGLLDPTQTFVVFHEV